MGHNMNTSFPPNIGLSVPQCPKCKNSGLMVRNLTVKILLTSKAKEKFEESASHYLCMDSGCPISYYGIGGNYHFEIADLKVPMWYKKNADPIFACYCNNITRDEVLEFVKQTGIHEMNKIIIRLRGKVKSACVAKNPTGRCCNEYFNELIDQGMKTRG